ncbi:hypothetical protein [Arthrobacter humicola]
MSEKKIKDRLLDGTAKDRKEIEDWINDSGAKVLGAVVVLLGLWTVVRMFWS